VVDENESKQMARDMHSGETPLCYKKAL